MGISSDGLLFWGYCFDDEVPWVDELTEEEWEIWYNEGWEELAIHWEVDVDFGCSIEFHCSYDYPMYAAVIDESCIRAFRGDPQRIEAADLKVGKDWKEELDTFCESMGIDVSGMEPGWHLASLYG